MRLEGGGWADVCMAPPRFDSPCLRTLFPVGADPHKMTQQPPPSPFSNVSRAARVAASNTSSTPSPVKLEHSRYLRAPISRAATSPSCSVTNRWLLLRISSMAAGSWRRSFFNPTRMMGTSKHQKKTTTNHKKKKTHKKNTTTTKKREKRGVG